jgi:hypothetical protein
MNSKRIPILSYLYKMPLLFLYVSFFIVQLFFNFDIAGNSKEKLSSVSVIQTAFGHGTSGIAQTKSRNEKPNKVRLNKRFEPKAITVQQVSSIKPPVHTVIIEKIERVPFVFIPASFLCSASFRGPPAVV